MVSRLKISRSPFPGCTAMVILRRKQSKRRASCFCEVDQTQPGRRGKKRQNKIGCRIWVPTSPMARLSSRRFVEKSPEPYAHSPAGSRSAYQEFCHSWSYHVCGRITELRCLSRSCDAMDPDQAEPFPHELVRASVTPRSTRRGWNCDRNYPDQRRLSHKYSEFVITVSLDGVIVTNGTGFGITTQTLAVGLGLVWKKKTPCNPKQLGILTVAPVGADAGLKRELETFFSALSAPSYIVSIQTVSNLLKQRLWWLVSSSAGTKWSSAQ